MKLTWERVASGIWALMMAACAGSAVERAANEAFPAWAAGLFVAGAVYHVARLAVRDERCKA